MDEATALKVLQGYGAPPTPANMQRIMQQGGSDSAILGKSMGLQGGGDESGYDDSILKSKLDKLDTASQCGPSITSEPLAPIPTSTTPTAIPIARAPVAPIKPRSGSAGMTEPDVAPQGGPVAVGDSGGGVLPWILAALGIKAGDSLLRGKPDVMPEGLNPISGKSLSGPAKMLRLEGPQAALPAPINPAINPANEAVDKIATRSESRRPINTNVDERNSEPVNKPTNLESRPVPIDDSRPVNLVEEIAKTLKRAPRGR